MCWSINFYIKNLYEFFSHCCKYWLEIIYCRIYNLNPLNLVWENMHVPIVLRFSRVIQEYDAILWYILGKNHFFVHFVLTKQIANLHLTPIFLEYIQVVLTKKKFLSILLIYALVTLFDQFCTLWNKIVIVKIFEWPTKLSFKNSIK